MPGWFSSQALKRWIFSSASTIWKISGCSSITDFRADNGVPLPDRIRNLITVIRSKTLLESGIWPPIILRRLGVGFYRHVDGYRRYQRVFKKAS